MKKAIPTLQNPTSKTLAYITAIQQLDDEDEESWQTLADMARGDMNSDVSDVAMSALNVIDCTPIQWLLPTFIAEPIERQVREI